MPPENNYSLNSVLHKYSEIQCGHKHHSSVSTADKITDQHICDNNNKTIIIKNKKTPNVENEYFLMSYKNKYLALKINKNTMTFSAGYMSY